ncbi:MAG: glycosyltransferase family 39 protein [Proteobacteria bacterium]|nr:glycosyltransferase family 39 protein [Pseudomonadota bacterium]
MARDHFLALRTCGPHPALAYAGIAIWSFVTLLTQFLFRDYDDNRLTSWRWVFTATDIYWLAPAHLAALLLAFILSKLDLPWRWPGTLLFISSCVVAVPFWSEPEVIVDAARYFTQAKQLEVYGLDYFLREWGGEITAWTDLPLLPLLYGLILRLAGESRTNIQAFTTLMFAASVVLTYGIGKKLCNERIGFWAGALLLGMPYLLVQVPLMLVDVAAMFFLCAALWTTLLALERGGAGWLALAAVAVVFATGAKYSNWLWLSVLAIVLVVRLREGAPSALPRMLWLATGAALLLALVAWPMAAIVRAQFMLLRDWQWPALGTWRESLVSTLLFQLHPFIALAALASLPIAWQRRDVRYAIIAWLPALALLLDLGRSRYLLPLLPMLALLAAYGLNRINDNGVRKFSVLCIVASSLLVAVFGFRPFLTHSSAANLQRAGAYLDTLDATSVEVITLPQLAAPINPALSVALLDYHTARRIMYRREPIAMPPGAETSPLRFSWTQNIPNYYAAAADGAAVVLVVAGETTQFSTVEPRLIGAGYGLVREFVVSTRVFGYQTMVRVYRQAQK